MSPKENRTSLASKERNFSFTNQINKVQIKK